MSTQQLRETFQISNLFAPGELRGHFTDLDRLVVGGAVPADKPIELPNHKESGRAFFLERRNCAQSMSAARAKLLPTEKVRAGKTGLRLSADGNKTSFI